MRVHFTGACGRAIGGLALSLQQRGWQVTASDAVQYEPMKSALAEAGLEIASEFAAKNVPRDAELVVTGSAVGEDNAELRVAKRRRVPVLNMAQFLGEHLLRRRQRLVVAGTNGKTTVTSMLVWILEQAGANPDYLIGGLSRHFPQPVRMLGARKVVLEGDEFWAGVRDRRPKFSYYRPRVLVLTNLHYDHAEMYRDLDEVESRFRELVESVPRGGAIIVAESCPRACAVANAGRASVVTVGRSVSADCRVENMRATRGGMSFSIAGQRFSIALPGAMNVSNAAIAARAAMETGVSLEAAAAALAEFRGVSGRLETVADSAHGTLIFDEGYHPRAFAENIAALRLRYPGRRLVVATLPRFTGGNDGFQMTELPDVLSAADLVILAGLYDPFADSDDVFSTRKLAARIVRLGTPVHRLGHVGRLPIFVPRVWKPGDVMLCSLPPGHEALFAPIARHIEEGRRG